MLETRDLTVAFGGVRALNDVSITVRQDRIVGLIGPNGAGKTTFIDAVTGFVPTSGSITLAGHRLTGLPPHRRSHLGLGRTWQSVELFDDLSVADNLAVAADRSSCRTVLRDLLQRRRRATDGVTAGLELLGIADLAHRLPSTLSYGQRKLVGIARALAADPQLICLDEPAAGLDSHETLMLGVGLRAVAEAGIGVLLVDHAMPLVLDVSEEVYVLHFGRVLAHGTPAEVRADRAVLDAYLGERNQ